ncbi:hypothetical protein A6R68_09535 [Neotoma lepida]|uniref:Uncharacterized protein n=1 Tax=Neotoma lepida TaxID=56216 RepID=A0A1A6G1S0_NEOLE|nr:hypothetical protein A6R68_09535 [Neotoma lepida]
MLNNTSFKTVSDTSKSTSQDRQSAGDLPAKCQGLMSHDPKLRVAEAQDLITSVEWFLKEKLGIHHRCAPSKKKLHQEPSQAPVSRHICHLRISSAEPKISEGNTGPPQPHVHQANPKVHSQPSTDKWMPYGNNQAQMSREAVSGASPYQHRVQAPPVPGTSVH